MVEENVDISREIKKALVSLKFFVWEDLPEVTGSEERYEIRLHPTFPTACWRWDKKERKHKILIGLGNDLREHFERNPEYMKSFGFHEISHSIHTERDVDRIKEVLGRESIPFPLLNLFEDARIEHLWREKLKRPFDWWRYERPKIEMSMGEFFKEIGPSMREVMKWEETGDGSNIFPRPEQVLLWIIQVEGKEIRIEKMTVRKQHRDRGIAEVGIYLRIGRESVRIDTEFTLPTLFSLMREEIVDTLNLLFNRIHSYYSRATEVKSFEDMVELLKEWIKEFGLPKDNTYPQLLPPMSGAGNPQSGSTSGSGNAVEMEIGMSGDEVFEQLWGEADDLSDAHKGEDSDDEDGDEGMCPGGMGEKDNREYKKTSGQDFFYIKPMVKIDWDRVNTEVERILKAFRKRSRKRDVINPSKKLSARKLAMDRDDIYRREEEDIARLSPFTILVDCSGSMYCMVPEQHILTAVFSELARRTGTEAYAIFTQETSAMMFRLPMREEDISRIPYDGSSENLLGGMEEFGKYIRRTKYLFVISDMQITDYAVKTREKIDELMRAGIETIGIYRGNDERLFQIAKTNSRQYFKKSVVTRETNPIDILIPILRTIVVSDR